MAAPISAEQIQELERLVEATMASDPSFSQAVRDGKVKYVVIPGDKVSEIKAIDLTNPDLVRKYGGTKLYDTPQEAEHFTEGYGNEPTRSGGLMDIIKRAVIPHSQYQSADPLRKYAKSSGADAVQDILDIGRYATPFLPISLAAVGLTNLGLGAVSNFVGDAAGDEELQETVPNLLANAATASLAAAGNRYYSKKATQDRHLADQLERQLGYEKRGMFTKSPIDKATLDDARKILEGGNAYTMGDWRNAPLNRFYEEVGTKALPMRLDFIPNVHEPTSKVDPKTKVHGTAAKIASKQKMPKWTAQQWDAVARKFMRDAGITNADPNAVRQFLEEAYFRPQSQKGSIFYAKGGLPEGFTTSDWAKFRATEGNEFAKDLLANKAHVVDPELDKQRAEALNERSARFNRQSTKSNKSALVTPQQFRDMGDYSVRLPFVRAGGKPIEFPKGRTIARVGATLLPLAAQAVLPYVIKTVRKSDGKQ